MGFLDMFDKLDDIIYKPVEAVCDWIKEPLQVFEHKRDMARDRQREQFNENMRRLEEELAMEHEEHAAKLQFQRQKWDVEINAIIAENEAEQRDRLVEAIKNYQVQLANASRDIVESIGAMSLKLRCMANDLVLEKTQEYKKIQDEAKRQSMQELKEAKDHFFESDQETYRMLVSDIMDERRSMVETAGKCIVELSEDLKRLNENTDNLMRQGMRAVEGYLKPMARAIGSTNINACEIQMSENRSIAAKEIIEVDSIEK